jgi:hypothetical protein
MFTFDGLPPESCLPCRQRKDVQYQKVREMVKDNPGITALEVHERTEVPLSTIAKYIESGLLEVMSTKEGLDNVSLQIWIDKTSKKAKEAKAETKQTETVPDIDEDLPEEPKSKKTAMKFIVK